MLAACFLFGSLFPSMPPEQFIPSLPFFTRDMLRFGQTAKLELRVDMQADEAAVIAISGVTREGSFTYRATTPSNSLNTSQTFGLSDIPIMVSVRDVSGNFEQGQAFITLSLLVNGDVVQVLTSGYIYNQKALSWPQTQQLDLRPGGGRIQRTVPTNPAAGLDIELIVPAGEVWKLRDMTFILATDATVANRRVRITIVTSFDQTIRIFSNTDQAASLTRIYRVAAFGYFTSETYGSDILIPIPDEYLLRAGDSILIEAVNMAAGDNFTPSEFTYEKFFATS